MPVWHLIQLHHIRLRLKVRTIWPTSDKIINQLFYKSDNNKKTEFLDFLKPCTIESYNIVKKSFQAPITTSHNRNQSRVRVFVWFRRGYPRVGGVKAKITIRLWHKFKDMKHCKLLDPVNLLLVIQMKNLMRSLNL